MGNGHLKVCVIIGAVSILLQQYLIKNKAGEKDPFWSLQVLPPDLLKEEFEKGTFEAVMLCVFESDIRNLLKKQMDDLGIPLFIPGKEEDWADADYFQQDNSTCTFTFPDQYNLYTYKNIMGAIADFRRTEVLFLFDENGKVNINNYKMYKEWFYPLLLSYPFRLKDSIPQKVYMKGDYCIMLKSFSSNYWHFTFEMLDCIYLLEKAGYKGKYIYNEYSFSKDLLITMGIDPDRLIGSKTLDLHKVYVFERVVDLYSSRSDSFDYSKEVLIDLAEFVKAKLKKNNNSPKKIYIKRIGNRKLLNGENIFKEKGFYFVIPEEHSVMEQINLFYNADIVICPHGANSTNVLYMRKGTVFAELFSDLWHMDYNSGFCKANGIHYLEAEGKSLGTGTLDRTSDYYINEDDLNRLINNAEEIIRRQKI